MTDPSADYSELLARAGEFLPTPEMPAEPVQETATEAIAAAAELFARAGEFTPPPVVPEPVLSREELLTRAAPFLAASEPPDDVDLGSVIAADGRARFDAELFLAGVPDLSVHPDGVVADDGVHSDEPQTGEPSE